MKTMRYLPNFYFLTKKILGNLFILIGMGIMMGFPIFIILSIFIYSDPGNEASRLWNIICIVPVAMYFVVVSLVVGFFNVNKLPLIWLNSEGIIISAHYLSKIKIPWQNVEGIFEGRWGYYVVKFKNKSFIHKLIGFYYLGKFTPCFLIDKNTENIEELIQAIRIKNSFMIT